jgi:hypothetical protein
MPNINRRSFLKTTALSAAAAGSAKVSSANQLIQIDNTTAFPSVCLGRHNVSRLILGGNPFSYIAHAEPLLYSRELFRHYLTHDKIVETMTLANQAGVNTFLGRIDNNVIGFLNKYEKVTGGSMPWLAQTSKKPQSGASREDILDNIRFAADNGATGIYLQGQSADYLVKEGEITDLEEYLSFIRSRGVLAGIGAHDIGTIESCEKNKIIPDFYMKTFNRMEYCCPNIARTKEIMAKVRAPWIAFKVLAAGRMTPKDGFTEALSAGADFLCVGMFDFQVAENVALFKQLLKEL